MIGYLKGNVFGGIEDGATIVTTDGVGYEVRVSPPLCTDFIALWTHEHAPQDAPHELYGFRERADRDLFRRLLSCKGIGPKVAMRIVANGGINADGVPVPATLRAIRGVGDKIIAVITEEFGS